MPCFRHALLGLIFFCCHNHARSVRDYDDESIDDFDELEDARAGQPSLWDTAFVKYYARLLEEKDDRDKQFANLERLYKDGGVEGGQIFALVNLLGSDFNNVNIEFKDGSITKIEGTEQHSELAKNHAAGPLRWVKFLPSLTSFKFGSTKLKGSLNMLSSLTGLQSVELHGHITGKLSDLSTLNALEYLKLSDCVDVTGSLSDLRAFSALKELDLDQCSHVTGTLSDLKVLPALEEVLLREVPVSGDVKDLHGLLQLTTLDIFGTQATDTIGKAGIQKHQGQDQLPSIQVIDSDN